MTTEVAIQEDQRSIQYKGVRGEDVKLTIPAIRSLFNVPKASDPEIFVFMRLCEAHKLNPFLREIYIIKYDGNAPASYVVGKDTLPNGLRPILISQDTERAALSSVRTK